MANFTSDNYGSFGGLHSAELPLNECNILLQGVPYENATSGKKGTSFAPSALRLISIKTCK